MQLQDLRILTSPKNFSDVKDKVTRGVFAIILNMIQALYSHVQLSKSSRSIHGGAYFSSVSG